MAANTDGRVTKPSGRERHRMRDIRVETESPVSSIGKWEDLDRLEATGEGLFVRTNFNTPPTTCAGMYTENMWCRWCGKFGLADQMVCADSECMTQDLVQGAALTGKDIERLTRALGHTETLVSAITETISSSVSAYMSQLTWST